MCTSLSVACIKDRKNTQITDLCRTATEAVHLTLKPYLAATYTQHNTFFVRENATRIHIPTIL